MTYTDLLAAVRARWMTVLACVVAILLATGVWTFFSPRVYSASATLLFDDFADGPDAAAGAGAGSSGALLLGTQADIITSNMVAGQMIRNLGLQNDPAIIARWNEATGGRGSIEKWLSRSLRPGLSVEPMRNTNVLAVRYAAADPDFAALIANGAADAFVQTQLRLKTEPAKVYSDWFGDQTRDVRARYEATQARLTRFQQEKGLIGGEKLDVELAHLREISTQLAGAEAAASDIHSRVSSRPASSPEVQGSPAVVGLRGALATKTAELAQLETTLGPNNPQVITAKAAVSTLTGKLGEAIGNATRSLEVAGEAASAREGDIRARLAGQRQRVLKLSSTQDQLAVLQRDVDAAKLAYDSVTERTNLARLRSEIPQTAVSVLDHAAPPTSATSPKVGLRMLLALLLGLGLGLGLVAVRELLSPRVRTAEGLAAMLGVATLVDLDEHRRARANAPGGRAA